MWNVKTCMMIQFLEKKIKNVDIKIFERFLFEHISCDMGIIGENYIKFWLIVIEIFEFLVLDVILMTWI